MKAKWIYLAIGFGLFIGFPGVGQIETPGEPINISNSSTACLSDFDCRPALAVRDGKVFVVWTEEVDSTQTTLYFSRSLDDGKTFTAPKPIGVSAGALAQQPDIGLASNGNILIAWSDNRSGDFDIFVTLSTDDGDTWEWDDTQDYLNLSDNSGDSLDPTMAVNNLGGLFVAWSDDTLDETLNPDGARNIFIRASVNPVQVGIEAEDIEDPARTETLNVSKRFSSSIGSPAEHPMMVIDPDDILSDVFIAWQQKGTLRDEIYFHQLSAFNPINVSISSRTESRRPAIAIRKLTEAGEVFERHQVVVAWEDQTNSDSRIISNSAMDAGLYLNSPDFSNAPLVVSESTDLATSPALAVNELGEFFIAWTARDLINRGPISIKLRSLSNAFGSTEEISSRTDDLDRDARNPALAADENNIYVAWIAETKTSDQADLFFARRLIRTLGF